MLNIRMASLREIWFLRMFLLNTAVPLERVGDWVVIGASLKFKKFDRHTDINVGLMDIKSSMEGQGHVIGSLHLMKNWDILKL